jgi:alanine racemase
MAVWQEDHVAAVVEAASRVGEKARLHLKVDTGMSRLGVQPEEVPAFARILEDAPGVYFEGLFTHYATADERDPTVSDKQELRFKNAIDKLEKTGLRPPLVHAANSAAALTRPQDHFDLVRVGISIYGLHPSKETVLPTNFRAALAWKTQLSQIKVLPPGRGLSYGHIYVTSSHERIGTLPVGYADGFRRIEGNQVLIGGQHVPVIGRVCMDQCMVNLDALSVVHVGDEVVLIGNQGEEHISAEDVAERWDTINYEVTCGVGVRVPRVYR